LTEQEAKDVFNEIYAQTHRHVLAYITAKCFDTADISDIFQEVYAELFTVISKKGKGYIKNSEAFVINIASQKLYRFNKKYRKLKSIYAVSFESDEDAISGLDFEAFENSVEEKAIKADTIGQVWDYLSEKTPDVRKVFHLRYSLDMTIPEIAGMLSFSESKVKNIIYRTLCQLREIYTEAGGAI
jgi:RNA polymerase sigma-70 factor (ECF subfamily)